MCPPVPMYICTLCEEDPDAARRAAACRGQASLASPAAPSYSPNAHAHAHAPDLAALPLVLFGPSRAPSSLRALP